MANEATRRRASESEEEKKADVLESLPLESSPYVQYTDLEDYKRMAYGSQGHIQPVPNQGAGGTEAPTLAGNGLTRPQTAAINEANRRRRGP